MTSKTLAITGAAAGIGRAAALRFASRGWTVAGFDIDEAGLATLARDITAAGGTAITGVLDVRDGAQYRDRLAEVVSTTGRLDVLVNNAGILNAGLFHEIDHAALTREVDVNVKGVLNGLHAGFPHLRGTPGSVVINLASASAIYGQSELANYSATKFYVRGLTEALNIEWAEYGIRVVDLWPLFVATAMLDDVSIGTTDSLGVRLNADDVAEVIWKAAAPGPVSRALRQVHFPVGSQARALTLGSRFSPAWLTRLVNSRLAGH